MSNPKHPDDTSNEARSINFPGAFKSIKVPVPGASGHPLKVCPNCNNANEHGDYEGPTCEVCLGEGFI